MFKSRNAHQGVRKRSLLGVYHLFDIDDKSPIMQFSDELNEFRAPHLLSEADSTDAFIPSAQGHVKGVGLVRSQSFPPEGWYKTTSKYILRISKKSLSAGSNGRLPTDRVMEHDEGMHSRTSTPPTELVDASPKCAGYIMSEAIEEQGQGSVINVTSEQLCGVSSAQEPAASSNQAIVNTTTLTPSTDVSLAIAIAAEGASSQSEISVSTPNLVESPRKVCLSLSTTSEMTALVDKHCVPVLPSGKVLVCGRRREMEDAASIVPSFLTAPLERLLADGSQPKNKTVLAWNYHGVFDGHGGSQASIYCMDRLHHLVAEEYLRVFGFEASSNEIGDEGNASWTEVMKAAFSKMDKEVGGVCPNALDKDIDGALDGGCLCCEDAIAPENVGTTAVVALVGVNQIVVANCGDSRAVLARGGQAIPLSRDHKPELEEETRRIEAAGGRVIHWDGYRVGGFLAVSRALGDRYLKRYVISEPEVTCIQRMEGDECLILASDGLWDVLGNEFACEVARKSFGTLRKKYESRMFPPGEDAAAAAVAALLVKLAYGRGSQDNISVVVVDLKSHKRSC